MKRNKPKLVCSSTTVRTFKTRNVIKRGGTYHQNIDLYKLPFSVKRDISHFCECNGIPMGKTDKYGDFIILQKEDDIPVQLYLNYFISKTGAKYVFAHNRKIGKTINITKLMRDAFTIDVFFMRSKKSCSGFYQNVDHNYILSI